MAVALKVDENTIRRDVDAVLEEWRQDAQIRDLWSHKESFDHLDEYDRMLMKIFYQKPRELPIGKHLIAEDRSFIKVQVLKVLLANLRVRNVMAGIGTVKVFEQLKFMRGERARGFEMTRTITYDEMKKAGVERIRKDPELQRRLGLIRDHPITTT